MTTVIKIDNTVHRTTTEWTPAVHQLLKYLETADFEGVPRVLGIDSEGREILSFIDGDAGYFDSKGTIPENLWSDAVLIDAAKFLRRLHDATSNFVAEPGTRWQFNNSKHYEVICHNDFGPWNAIFVGGQLKGIIDFDTASPGSRIDDIAYAVYNFVPLFRPAKCQTVGLKTPPSYDRKLKLFCDAYGSEYCNGVIEAVIARIESIRDWVIQEAKAGDLRFQRKVDEGHVADYDADITFLRTNWAKLQNHLRYS